MSLREAVLDRLRLLANLDAQRSYEESVPIADVPAELVCGWFDDAYHPESRVFQQQFSPAELDALSQFSSQFEKLLQSFGGSLPPLSTLQESVPWQRLAQAAAAVLSSLAGHAA